MYHVLQSYCFLSSVYHSSVSIGLFFLAVLLDVRHTVNTFIGNLVFCRKEHLKQTKINTNLCFSLTKALLLMRDYCFSAHSFENLFFFSFVWFSRMGLNVDCISSSIWIDSRYYYFIKNVSS